MFPINVITYALVDIYKRCRVHPDLYKPYEHIPCLYKTCQAHPRSLDQCREYPKSIQAVPLSTQQAYKAIPSTPLVYTSTLQMYTSCAAYIPWRCTQAMTSTSHVYNTHPKYIQAVTSTPLAYASRAKHTSDLYKHTPSLYKHTPYVYKLCWVHLRCIQAMPSISPCRSTIHTTVYTGRAEHILVYASLAKRSCGLSKHTQGLYMPYRVHPSSEETHQRSTQTVSSTPQIYTSRSEYTAGQYR